MQNQPKMISRVEGSGPDLVLLHGWGLNSVVWQKLLPALIKNYRVHLIDLPGFGENASACPSDFTLYNISQMVAPLIPTQSIVLGWSMGGLVALSLELEQLTNIRRLVLVASSPCFIEKPAQNWPGIKPDVLRLFASQLDRNIDKTLQRFLAIQAMGSPSSKEDVRYIGQALKKSPQPVKNALYGGLDILENTDLRDKLSQLQIDSHWILGTGDSLVPKTLAEELKNICSSTEVTLLNRTAHAPFVTDAERFIEVLESIIRS